jgi:ABC-type Zn uptake system ZnuABC Zn-binding protein ZnuA
MKATVARAGVVDTSAMDAATIVTMLAADTVAATLVADSMAEKSAAAVGSTVEAQVAFTAAVDSTVVADTAADAGN